MKHMKSHTSFYLVAGPLVFGIAYALIAAFTDSPDGFLSPGVIEYSSSPLWALFENTKMFLVFLPFAIIGSYFYTGLIFLIAGLACGFWKRKFGTAPLWLAIATALIMSAASGFALHKVRWFMIWPDSFHSILHFAEWSIPLLLASTAAWLAHKRYAEQVS